MATLEVKVLKKFVTERQISNRSQTRYHKFVTSKGVVSWLLLMLNNYFFMQTLVLCYYLIWSLSDFS